MTINLLDTGFVGSLGPAGTTPPPTGDPDAVAYMLAVEAADGQALEAGVRTAINNYVVAVKAAPGIWAGINIFAPMAGPRTLAGCMVPLKGATTFLAFNLTSGDYSRTHGLRQTRQDMWVMISDDTYSAIGPNSEAGVSSLMTAPPSHPSGNFGITNIFGQWGTPGDMLNQRFDVEWDVVNGGFRAARVQGSGWGYIAPGMNYAARISATQVRWKFTTSFQGNSTLSSNVQASTPRSPVFIYREEPGQRYSNMIGMCFAVDVLGAALIDSAPYRGACLAYHQALIAALA